MGKKQNESIPDSYLEKDWHTWTAPIRPFKRQDKDFWITCIAILVLVGVIFFFAKDFLVIIPACALLFLYYVMSTIPPEHVEIKLTNRGVYLGPSFFPWEIINSFYFGTNTNNRCLLLQVDINFFVRQISLIINPEDEETIKAYCLKRLPLVQEQPRFIENFTSRLSKLLPFEDKKTPNPPASS